jgi:hypothetical protein
MTLLAFGIKLLVVKMELFERGYHETHHPTQREW